MSKATLLRMVFAVLFFTLLICGVQSALAQQVSVAQVAGQVTDNSGAIIPSATVRMIETQRGVVHTATTDTYGRYVMPGLPVGAYRLEVQKESFKTYVQNGIELQVNDHVTLNGVLQAGAVSQVVEVNAGAAMVQTETTSVSNVVDSQRMVDLPLNGRYVTQLIYTMPATVSGASQNLTNDSTGSKSFFSSVTISVAGGQTNGTNYLLDGGDHNDTFGNVNLPFPFPDALQEFSVETSALPARNGLHPGGVVNAVTKSGTNSFHGTLFDFDRDGIFNAKPRGFTPAGSAQDRLRRNQFGGTIGGPILHTKLFFFAGYQGTRLKSLAANQRVKTVTQAALNGDFSTIDSAGCANAKALKPPFGPPNNNTNQINPSQFDPAALKLFSGGYVPISSDPCGFITYSLPTINNEDQVIGRVDYNLSLKHNLFGRYLLDQYASPPPFDAKNLILTQFPGNLERAQSFVLGDNYTFTPTFLNSTHFTFSRRRDNRGPDPRDINPTTLGVNMSPTIPNFLLLNLTGYFMVGCGTCAPGHFNVNTWQAADDIDWIRGRHHFAFGGEYIHTQNNTLTGYNENGTFSFSGGISGDGLADFLLGNWSGWDQSRPQQVAYRQSMISFYAQDTIRFTPRLTVIAGLRWEPSLAPYDYFHRGSLFNLADFQNNVHSSVYPTAPAGMLFYGDRGVPAGFTNNHWGNFGPRLGVTFDPTGSGKQVFRVGYGLLYDSTMSWYSQRLTSNPPVVNEINITTAGCGTFTNPWLNYSTTNGCVANSNTNQNPFPGGFTFFPGAAQWVSLLPNMRPTYMMQWNATYENQFASNWVATLSYVGSRTLHLPFSYDLNWSLNTPSVCAKFTGGCSASNEPQRRYLAQIATSAAQGASLYGQFFYADDTGNSNYNGLIAALRHRLARNFTWLANYTFSHCLGTGDFTGDLRATYYSQQNNPSADYGNCNFDTRHIFNTSVVATSPSIGSGVVHWLLGGWQVSPSVRATSGLPANITLGADNSLTGEGTGIDRPNLNPGVPLYVNSWVPQGTGWAYQVFNKAAFSTPAKGQFGNLRRDFLRYPGAWTVDMSISRSFPIRERIRLEGRLDMFNAFNHWNPVQPSANMSSSTFGLVTSAPSPSFVPQAASWNDPRVLQLAVKINF
jgi:hypothetical protein